MMSVALIYLCFIEMEGVIFESGLFTTWEWFEGGMGCVKLPVREFCLQGEVDDSSWGSSI